MPYKNKSDEKKYRDEHKKESKKYNKEYYQKHKDALLDYVNNYYKKHKKEKAKYNKRYSQKHKMQINIRRKKERKEMYKNLKINGCAICGSYIRLDFHHPNKEDKLFNISEGHNYSKEKLSDEINKCILLCRRCHRNVHTKEKS